MELSTKINSTNITNMDNQEQLKQLSSYISKLIKSKFGKGPGSCYSFQNKQFIVIHIRNFLCPLEQTLMDAGRIDIVKENRKIIMNSIFQEIKIKIKEYIGVTIETYDHDWNYDSKNGIIVVKLERNERCSEINNIVNVKSVLEEIKGIQNVLHKKLDHINIYQVSTNIYLIEIDDFFLPYEQELKRKGLDNLLNNIKRKEIKKYFLQESAIKKGFERECEDIFVCLDNMQDKGLICIVLK